MQVARIVAGSLAFAAAGVASAGTPVGISLGSTLGSVLGQPVGDLLPIAGSGVLLLGAATLGLGIYLSRRKRR